MENSKVCITRKKAIINGNRDFEVFIDEKQEMLLSNGEFKTKMLKPGRYRVQVKMGRKGSSVQEFEVKPGKPLNLNASTSMGFYYASIIKFCIVFTLSLFIVFGDVGDQYVFILLGAIGLDFILQYTLFKRSFITLKNELEY